MEGIKDTQGTARSPEATIIVKRASKETDIACALRLARGAVSVKTGLGFLDHMVTSLAYHAAWSLSLTCKGDLSVDDHHSAEDCAIALGLALKEAVADHGAIRRFGAAYAPLDEALARAVVDVSGRPFCDVSLQLQREAIGDLATENIGHFLASFAANAGITLHVDVLKGVNDHHKAEAAFKALALALRDALVPIQDGVESSDESTKDNVASTKGKPTVTVERVFVPGEEARL